MNLYSFEIIWLDTNLRSGYGEACTI